MSIWKGTVVASAGTGMVPSTMPRSSRTSTRPLTTLTTAPTMPLSTVGTVPAGDRNRGLAWLIGSE